MDGEVGGMGGRMEHRTPGHREGKSKGQPWPEKWGGGGLKTLTRKGKGGEKKPKGGEK